MKRCMNTSSPSSTSNILAINRRGICIVSKSTCRKGSDNGSLSSIICTDTKKNRIGLMNTNKRDTATWTNRFHFERNKSYHPYYHNYPITTTTTTNYFLNQIKKEGLHTSHNHEKHKIHNQQKENTSSTPIRLSKRMSELNLCSRREADKLISQSRVIVNGVRIDVLGTKVSPLETNIRIVDKNANHSYAAADDDDDNLDLDIKNDGSNTTSTSNTMFHWDKIRGDTVVLHKPKDYVSGQPDPKHGHVPAVRLLTRNNIYFPTNKNDDDVGDNNYNDHNTHDDYEELKYTLANGNYLHFGRKKLRRHRHRRDHDYETNNEDEDFYNDDRREKQNYEPLPSTLINYAPAGRLDLDSSGVLLFTKNGVIAKQILSSLTEKEYIVRVEPVHNITRYERNMGIASLPYPPKWDLSVLMRGGKRLWNDSSPLKPVIDAQWVDEGKKSDGEWDGTGTIKFVLQEGKKRQIRRMCREFLGLNVTELKRVRVGSVQLGDLPEGRWRTLTEREVRHLLQLQ